MSPWVCGSGKKVRAPLSHYGERLVVLDHGWPHDRRIRASWRRFDAVAEGQFQPLERKIVGKNVDQAAALEHIAPEIVDTVDMVGMRMRVDHGVDVADAGGQHLGAEIRSGIDDHACGAGSRNALDHRGRACAPILRIGGIAGAPVAGDARRAWRRAAAQNGEAQRIRHQAGLGILVNSLKKLVVVISAISSVLTPMVSASTAAVLAT